MLFTAINMEGISKMIVEPKQYRTKVHLQKLKKAFKRGQEYTSDDVDTLITLLQKVEDKSDGYCAGVEDALLYSITEVSYDLDGDYANGVSDFTQGSFNKW